MLLVLGFFFVVLLYDQPRAGHTPCHFEEARARQEGSVVLYSSLLPEDNRILIEAFRKWSDIPVELRRDPAPRLLQRLVSELRAAIYQADAVLTLGSNLEELKARPEPPLDPCPPEEPQLYPSPRRDPAFRWTGITLNLRPITINTQIVGVKDRPVQYKDLLNPKWREKIVFNPDDLGWFAGLVQLGEKVEGIEFVRSLAKQNPRQVKTPSALVEGLARGEFAIALNASSGQVSQLKQAGAPIDFLFVRPVLADAYGVGVLNKAPHPNAGRLFVKFLTSTQGQRVILEMLRRTPARIDFATGIQELEQRDISVLDAVQFVEKRASFAAQLKNFMVAK
jgi:iron(III) transport system substrate-binding protein